MVFRSFCIFLCGVVLFFAGEKLSASNVSAPLLTSTYNYSIAVTKTSAKSKRSKKRVPPYKPAKRYLTQSEIEGKNIYAAMAPMTSRMCIKEVPFFLALHQAFYNDNRLLKGDTLALKKNVMVALLTKSLLRSGQSSSETSPAISIDSMFLCRPKGKNGKRGFFILVVFAQPGSYVIPKTGARVRLPGPIRTAVSVNPKNGFVQVTIYTKSVTLELPNYAKILSLGIVSDMDIRYAELAVDGKSYEGRLLYRTQEKEKKRRGWTFNITDCNKIRPYSR